MKRLHLFLFSASAGLLVSMVALSVYFYNLLPTEIPTHFGFSGNPDAWTDKNYLTIFLLPLIWILLFSLFVLLYRHPQYSSWPTTLILMAVEEKKRNEIYEILRTMNAVITFIISLLFTYIQFAIIATGNNRTSGLNSYVMLSFLGAIVLLIITINTRMLITVRRLTK